VHTVAEYHFFKQNIDAFRAASTRDAAPELAYKTTDYIAFAVFWNRQVMMQSPQIIEADRRLYLKLPEQLLWHHKKTLQWKSSCATLYLGSNTECLAPIQELLGDANRLAVVLPAIPLEPEQVDFNADGTSFAHNKSSKFDVSPQPLSALTWNHSIPWPFDDVLLKSSDPTHISILCPRLRTTYPCLGTTYPHLRTMYPRRLHHPQTFRLLPPIPLPQYALSK
jgi:hypothetical protein